MRRTGSLQDFVKRNEPNPGSAGMMEKKKKSSNKHRKVQVTASYPIDVASSYTAYNEIRSATQLHLNNEICGSMIMIGDDNNSPSPPHSPTHPATLPWFLQSSAYGKSPYHYNKILRQLSSGGGSLHSFNSLQSLNNCDQQIIRHHHHYEDYGNNLHDRSFNSGDSFYSNSSSILPPTPTVEKKKKKLRLKKVLQMLNFPKKLRQREAEKKRFNLNNVPQETANQLRDQLKQIYVY